MLRNYTKGKIDYFKNPKVHEIAKFQESIAINETQAVSCSDASIAFNPPLELSHFLKSIYPDVQIPSIPKPKKESDLHSLLWINSEFADCKMQPTDKIYHTAQWFIKRGSVYNFACKGGRNNEPHNHNDVGSFMISKCGRVTFTDIGVGKYTRQYFSSERYTVFEPSSRSHSVPIINGELQSATEEKAEVYIETPNEYAFTMQGAYNVASLKSLKRHFKYEEAVLTLSDSYEFTEMPTSLVERFVSLLPITLGEGSAFCGDTVLEFDNSLFDAEITTEECVRKNGSRETVYILDLKLKRLESKISLDFVFK